MLKYKIPQIVTLTRFDAGANRVLKTKKKLINTLFCVAGPGIEPGTS